MIFNTSGSEAVVIFVFFFTTSEEDVQRVRFCKASWMDFVDV